MIQFIKKRRLWYSLSTLVMVVGVFFMVSNYLNINHVFNLGIDFTGGTSITLRFNQDMKSMEEKFRLVMVSAGLSKHTIQTADGNSVVIKTQEIGVEKRNQLFDSIRSKIGGFEVMEVDIIGPSIGDQLRKTSLFIILAVSIAILLYNSWRFEFTFGFASIVALIHDMFIVLCITAIFQLEVNTAFVAALLTVLGYSINDTIVIFDRIRESIKQDESEDSLSKDIVNTAVNSMVARSIHTTLTTCIVAGSIFIFGGLSLKVFSSVLLIGLLTGTYSSLFIASPMIVTISKFKGVPVV